MADLQALIKAVDELSADELKKLYTHIVETRLQFADVSRPISSSPRILGLFEHIGETWMSDDFTAELPDAGAVRRPTLKRQA
ncbi:MAG: hypothetical protein KF716_11015 [Anaerolineae bacterium]|nr:hypothetical protein [Anaerolineae bacterium]